MVHATMMYLPLGKLVRDSNGVLQVRQFHHHGLSWREILTDNSAW